jgi:histidinol dehydrogenase
VGIYVPHGKGSVPSVAYMLTVPAFTARVPRVAVCTPPGPDGHADPVCVATVAMVAERFERTVEVFKVGGAQAMAALAFGISPLPRVAKVVGPGNEFVTAAKRVLSGVFDVGTPAGPSESVVVCDEATDPLLAAHELLVEAEHGPKSASVLVTHSLDVAHAVARAADRLIEALPEPQRSFCRAGFASYGGVVVTSSLQESLQVASDFAAEHVHVLTANAHTDSLSIRDAGEILLGEFSSIPFGNFCIGLNAVLPTGGFARSFSGIGVNSFLKRTSVAQVSAPGALALAPAAQALAAYEGFPAHLRAAAAAATRAGEAS